MEIDKLSESSTYGKSAREKSLAKSIKDPIVSHQEVEAVVKQAFGSQTKLVDYHVKSYSEEKLGFMGAHQHLVVSIQKAGSVEKELKTFFLKSVPHDIEEQALVIEESNMFFKEANFHRIIMPELLKNIKDKSWSVSCFLIKDDAMVFEDLKFRNFGIKGKFLDTNILKSALSGLAKLHVSSILAERSLGKSFIDIHPKILEEGIFSPHSRFSEWFRTGVEVAVSVAKSLGLDATSIPRICHRIFELVSASKNWRNVICHGDAWSYNLMFDDSKPLPTCVMVDYQLIRYASAMTDVAQLIYLTTKRQYRDDHEMDLLMHYHEVFCKNLRDNHSGNPVPNFSDLQKEYEEMRLVGIVTASLYFPINQIEGKLCAEMTKDSDGFSKLLFQDRSDLVLHLMRKDANYRERITEVIQEMVQRSKQLLA